MSKGVKKNNNIDDLDFEKKILYFIHIPKTGGSSLKSDQIISLGHGFNICNSYRTPAYLNGFSGYSTDTWEQYKFDNPNNLKITIIRNPFDLLCSYYHYGEKLLPNNEYCHSGWASVNFTHQFKSFEEFINAYCDPEFKWHQPLFKQFLYSQLFNKDDDCVTEIIIKLEFYEN